MSVATETRLTRWRQAIDEAEPILGDVEPIQMSSYGRGDTAAKFLLRYEDFRRLFSGKEVTKETDQHGVFYYYQVGLATFEANEAPEVSTERVETVTMV